MRRTESGQTTVLVLGLALVSFAIAGLAVDGTRAFLFRRSLQNSADAAAIAAAGEVDRGSYYSSGGRVVRLDQSRAEIQAMEMLGARSFPARIALDADPTGVRIVLRARMPTSFLGVVGIEAIPVAVEAAARPIPGPPG